MSKTECELCTTPIDSNLNEDYICQLCKRVVCAQCLEIDTNDIICEECFYEGPPKLKNEPKTTQQ